MADWADVSRIALAMPEAVEAPGGHHGLLTWKVRGAMFAWERPLGRTDLEALGDAAPDGPILGVRVADLGVKDALLADQPNVLFTTPHFDGYAAVLIRLEPAEADDLEELITESWLLRAPKKLAAAWLAEHTNDEG